MSTATAIGPNISNGGKRIIDMTIPYRMEVEASHKGRRRKTAVRLAPPGALRYTAGLPPECSSAW
ncbi:hypothetical protein J4558_21375 [Leptolyngbya sp. 15MV]|nr:hypothetical protein J4558_21375 [Leptolyngbya sp. 15MV]